MAESRSSSHDSNDFNFDDDFRRPRRAAAAASRSTFIESGTDDEEAAGSKRKKKVTKTKPAKRARHQTDSSDSDEEKDADMRNLTEKERELQIFKHIEHQELLKTRKEIQQKLMGDVDEEKHRPKKRKEEPKPAPPQQQPTPTTTTKSDKESGEESSSSEDDVPKTKSPTPKSQIKDDESEKEEEEEESSESEVELDTEFHKPSEIAKKMDKKNAIAELVKSRKEKKNNEEKKRDQVLDADKIFGGGNRAKEDKSDSDDSSSSDSSGSDSESENEADNNSKPQGEEVDSYEQLNEIRLSRHKLAKLCHTPFFDKTVLGCFVRIGVGQVNGLQVYRAAQVVGVVESAKVYDVEATRTNKALRLKHGPDERVWRLEFASNSEITNSEYLKWRDAMKKAKLPLPTTDYIQRKRNDIVSALDYNFTDEDVKKMVQQRQKFVSGTKNHAAQKAALLKMKLDSDQSGDISKSNQLQIQIDQIDEIIKKKELDRCHDTLGITAINQRNRDTQQRALAEKSLRRISIDTEDDPFTRKSGKSRMVSGRTKKGEEGGVIGIDGSEKEEEKVPIKGRLSSLKSTSSSSSLNHSISAPQLMKYDPAMILGELSNPFESSPSPQPTVSTPPVIASSATKPSGISFAEFRRRKAEASASGGK